jgi:UDP-glucose 4-epimerase
LASIQELQFLHLQHLHSFYFQLALVASQKRNFTHIDDIIDGLVLVGENGYGDEFGIGSGEAYSIKEIAEMFDGEIEMLPERAGNRMSADVVSAKTEALGWKPSRTIKEYIEKQRANNWN